MHLRDGPEVGAGQVVRKARILELELGHSDLMAEELTVEGCMAMGHGVSAVRCQKGALQQILVGRTHS